MAVFINTSDAWGDPVEVTAKEYERQAGLYGHDVEIEERDDGIYIDGKQVAELTESAYVYAQHTSSAGRVYCLSTDERAEDASASDDYIEVGIKQARSWAASTPPSAGNAFTRKAGGNALKALAEED